MNSKAARALLLSWWCQVLEDLLCCLINGPACEERAGGMAKPHRVSIDAHSPAWECTHMATHSAHSFLRGHLQERRSRQHRWGAPEEQARGCSVQYDCTEQVRLTFFLILAPKKNLNISFPPEVNIKHYVLARTCVIHRWLSELNLIFNLHS